MTDIWELSMNVTSDTMIDIMVKTRDSWQMAWFINSIILKKEDDEKKSNNQLSQARLGPWKENKIVNTIMCYREGDTL